MVEGCGARQWWAARRGGRALAGTAPARHAQPAGVERRGVARPGAGQHRLVGSGRVVAGCSAGSGRSGPAAQLAAGRSKNGHRAAARCRRARAVRAVGARGAGGAECVRAAAGRRKRLWGRQLRRCEAPAGRQRPQRRRGRWSAVQGRAVRRAAATASALGLAARRGAGAGAAARVQEADDHGGDVVDDALLLQHPALVGLVHELVGRGDVRGGGGRSRLV
jgi:hypothetical protein